MSTSRGPSPRTVFTTGERRRARERALALLYESEVKAEPLDAVLAELPVAPEPYAETLARGVAAHTTRLDLLISAHAQAWSVARMPAIDRQLLRLGTYELDFEREVPAAVVLDEAIELAKQYSTEDSSRFVNGVLAALARELRGNEVSA